MHATTSPVTAAHSGLVQLVCAGVLWGTGGLTGTQFARVSGVSPLAVAAYRLALGGVLLVAVLLLSGRRVPRGRAAWRRIGLFGGLAAFYQACYFAAVSLTSVSLATLVTIGTAPVLVLLAEAATGRRRLDARGVGTMALALAGLGLLVGLPSGGFGVGAVVASAGLAVASAAGFALMTLVCATPVPGLDGSATTGYGLLAGGAALVAAASVTTGLAVHPGVTAFGLLAYLGVGPTAVAYALFSRGVVRAGPRTAALLALLEPLTGTLLAAVLLHDRLGAAGIAGAVLLGVAVLLAGQPGGRRQRPS